MRRMLRGAAFASAILLCAGTALAQERTIPPESSLVCHTNLVYGAGATYLRVCFSDHGNINRFESPATKEQLVVGYEGYLVCSNNNPVAYDAGDSELNWAPPLIQQPNGPNTLPLTIIRNTTNGKFQLKQVFSRDAAEYDITVTMTLLNISGVQQTGVRLDRYADVNIDNTFGNDRLDKTLDSVFGKDTGTDGFMMMAPPTTSPAHTTAVHGYGAWQRGVCNQASVAVPTAAGDWVSRISYNIGTMNMGASKTMKVIYRRY